MTIYLIEKWTGSGNPKIESESRYDWSGAWGLKPRTYPKANNDAEAINIFKNETAKSHKTAFRLRALGGIGYGVTSTTLASANCSK